MAHVSGILKSAEHYRTRALEVRAIASVLSDGAARTALLEVADEYDRVATALEAKCVAGKAGKSET